MEDLFRVRLNGRHILSLTRFTTVDEIENFFNTIYNAKICLILCKDKQILHNTEISSISDLKLDCFSKIFVNGNNIFIFHHFRKSNVYYRCKYCRRCAYFKDGKFKDKHLNKCRLIRSQAQNKRNKEAETYFKSNEFTSEVSIENNQFDSDSMYCSTSLYMKLMSKSEEVTDNYINSNDFSPKYVDNLSLSNLDNLRFSVPNVVTNLPNRQSGYNLNERLEITNDSEKKFERIVE
jgi:hypothetical protein